MKANVPLTNKEFFFDFLYPLQDQVLSIIAPIDTNFYLTGGTALSRGYLNHRFSEDLDLFVNLDQRYSMWREQIIAILVAERKWTTEVLMKQEHFLRMMVIQENVALKIECINDVPSYIGKVQQHPALGRLDNPENILANKLTALIGRNEPKDIADVWGLCCKMGLSIQDAIANASGKAAGIYPPDIARRLCPVSYQDWEAVMWITPPDPDQFITEVNEIGESLVLVQ